MALIQSWELSRYSDAAVLMCGRLNENPYEIVPTSMGECPRWMVYAIRMHEHVTMIDCMRQFGVDV